MKNPKLELVFGWMSLLFALVAVILIAYVKYKFVFESGNEAAALILVCLGSSLISILLGLFSLRTWPAIVAIILAAAIFYFLFFTRLYGLS